MKPIKLQFSSRSMNFIKDTEGYEQTDPDHINKAVAGREALRQVEGSNDFMQFEGVYNNPNDIFWTSEGHWYKNAKWYKAIAEVFGDNPIEKLRFQSDRPHKAVPLTSPDSLRELGAFSISTELGSITLSPYYVLIFKCCYEAYKVLNVTSDWEPLKILVLHQHRLNMDYDFLNDDQEAEKLYGQLRMYRIEGILASCFALLIRESTPPEREYSSTIDRTNFEQALNRIRENAPEIFVTLNFLNELCSGRLNRGTPFPRVLMYNSDLEVFVNTLALGHEGFSHLRLSGHYSNKSKSVRNLNIEPLSSGKSKSSKKKKEKSNNKKSKSRKRSKMTKSDDERNEESQKLDPQHLLEGETGDKTDKPVSDKSPSPKIRKPKKRLRKGGDVATTSKRRKSDKEGDDGQEDIDSEEREEIEQSDDEGMIGDTDSVTVANAKAIDSLFDQVANLKEEVNKLKAEVKNLSKTAAETDKTLTLIQASKSQTEMDTSLKYNTALLKNKKKELREQDKKGDDKKKGKGKADEKKKSKKKKKRSKHSSDESDSSGSDSTDEDESSSSEESSEEEVDATKLYKTEPGAYAVGKFLADNLKFPISEKKLDLYFRMLRAYMKAKGKKVAVDGLTKEMLRSKEHVVRMQNKVMLIGLTSR